MELTLEHIAEEVWTLKGAYNGISEDVKEIKKDIRELYNKTERDKTDIKTDLIAKIAETETKLFSKITETKTELIQWQIGLLIGFTTVIITAIWAILSFAVK